MAVSKWQLTNSAQCRFVRTVSTLLRITAIVLLAVWLTATQHCAIEAAGIWGSANGETNHACCSSRSPCTNVGCHVVERGSITATKASVKVPTPDLQVVTSLLYVHLIVPSTIADRPAEYDAGIAQALDWVPTWHFERRAAPSPRAPSLTLA